MKHRPLRHRLEYLAYRGVHSAFCSLPHGAVQGLGRGLGRLGYPVLRGHRQLALENLAASDLGLSRAGCASVARACFAHFGTAFSEVLSLTRFGRDALLERFEIEGLEHLDAAQAGGRGVLLIAGHYGSWQATAFPLGLLRGPIHIAARPPDNAFVGRHLDELRAACGNLIVPRGAAGKRMLTVLRSGGRVAIVVDHRPPPGQGIHLPFLGRPARTNTIPAFLAQVSGAAAVPITTTPLAGGRYHVRIGEPIEALGEGEAGVEETTRAYLETVEKDVRERPELWFWLHDRWKK